MGPFGVEFLAVNHSIPDAMAVAITTDAGRVFTPGTSRSTICRWTVGSPTATASPVWVMREWIC